MKITRFETRFQSVVSKLNRFKAYNPLNYVFKPKETINIVEKKALEQETVIKPVKIKLRQRIINHMKTVAADYQDVGIHTWKEAKLHPIKTAFYLTIFGGSYAAIKTNPSYLQYRSSLIDLSNDLILYGSSVRNKKCEYYMDHLNKLDSLSMLEHRDYLFFSLIKRSNFNPECDLYEKQSKPLNNPSKWNIFNYANLFFLNLSTIVDIGAFNSWFFLRRRLENSDINDDEWKDVNLNAKE